MKRKIFSKLLMVALVIAAVGSFVSCKDYDDDINNLQKQIDAKAALSELTALQSTLESKIASAQSAATAAQAKADAAATKTSVDELKKALETAIADAKKAGTDAGTKAGEAITAANKAQETADAAAAAAKKADEDAKAALADALKTIEETYQTKADAEKAVAGLSEAIAAVKETADAAFTKAEAEKLQEQVDGLKAELEAAIDEKIDAKIQEVNNAVASVDAIWSTITSLELVPSQYGSGALRTQTLYFLKGTEVNNAFGAAVIPAGNAAMPYDGHAVAEIKNYKAGDEIKFDNRIIVRVNPVNATFTADDVVLLNSQGGTLNDLVDVKVEKYTQLITRGDYENGLWTISFIRKAGVTEADFQKATEGEKYDAVKKPLCAGDIVYAIAINNSKDAAETRYAATTFDVDVFYGDYVRPNNFTFDVIGTEGKKDITELRNRWDGAAEKLIGEDKTAEKVVPGKWNAELAWKALDKGKNDAAFANHVDTTSVDATKKETRNWEYGNAANKEARYGENFAYIKVDADQRTFVIDGIKKSVYNATTNLDLVQWYYVTLDKFAAVESAPSEWESWNSYSYTGLYTVTPAIDRLRITIDSEAAIGDIIGFRVFAVNYDGSLADPDGRAFYVKIGDVNETSALEIKGSWIARVNGAGDDATYNALASAKLSTPVNNSNIVAWSMPAGTKDGVLSAVNGDAAVAKTDNIGKIHTAGKKLWWQLLDKNKTALAAGAKLSDVAFIAAGYENSLTWVDDQEITVATLTVKDPDHHNNTIYNVAVKIAKKLPTTVGSTFSWKYGLAPSASGALDVYPQPALSAAITTPVAWATEDVDAATFNLADLTTGMDANYVLNMTYTASDGKNYNVFKNATGNAAAGAKYTWSTTVGNLPASAAAAAGNTGGTFLFNKSYNATLAYKYVGITRTYRNTAATGYSLLAGTTNEYYNDDVDKLVAESTLKTITFKDALEPGIQTYAWNAYNYSFKPSATGAATTVANSTDYMLFYNGKPATLTASQVPYDADEDGVADLLNGETLVKYGDDATLEKYVTDNALVVSLTALTKGSNVVNQLDATAGINFTGGFNVASYSYATTYKFNSVAAGGALGAANTAAFRARLVAPDGITEYYRVAITKAAGALTFYKLASAPVPTTHTATLKIYAIDAFSRGFVDNDPAQAGNDDLANAKPIIELPIKIVVE